MGRSGNNAKAIQEAEAETVIHGLVASMFCYHATKLEASLGEWIAGLMDGQVHGSINGGGIGCMDGLVG